ncbi:MAG: hypothetical protein AAF431_18010 [Pseudomonadota bacterium]
MRVVTSTEKLQLGVIPPVVLRLLSHYAHELKKETGFVLKLGSKHIMRDLHYANVLSDSENLHGIYDDILLEINVHLADQEGRLMDQAHAAQQAATGKSSSSE